MSYSIKKNKVIHDDKPNDKTYANTRVQTAITHYKQQALKLNEECVRNAQVCVFDYSDNEDIMNVIAPSNKINDVSKTRYYAIAVFNPSNGRIYYYGYLEAFLYRFRLSDCIPIIPTGGPYPIRVRCDEKEIISLAERYYKVIRDLSFVVIDSNGSDNIPLLQNKDDEVDYVALIKYEYGFVVMQGLIPVSKLPAFSYQAIPLTHDFPFTDEERTSLLEWTNTKRSCMDKESSFMNMVNPWQSKKNAWKAFNGYQRLIFDQDFKHDELQGMWFQNAYAFYNERRVPLDFWETLLKERINILNMASSDPAALRKNDFAMLRTLPGLFADQMSFAVMRETITSPGNEETLYTSNQKYDEIKTRRDNWIKSERKLMEIRLSDWASTNVCVRVIGRDNIQVSDLEIDKKEPDFQGNGPVFRIPMEKCIGVLKDAQGDGWRLFQRRGYVSCLYTVLPKIAAHSFDPINPVHEVLDFENELPLQDYWRRATNIIDKSMKTEAKYVTTSSSSSASIFIPKQPITDENELKKILPDCIRRMHNQNVHLNNYQRYVYAAAMFHVGWVPQTIMKHRDKEFQTAYSAYKHKIKRNFNAFSWQYKQFMQGKSGSQGPGCASMDKKGLCSLSVSEKKICSNYNRNVPSVIIKNRVHQIIMLEKLK